VKWAIRWISLIHECILSIFYFKSFTRTIMAYSEYYVSLTFSLKRSLITYSLKQWILFFLPNQSFYFSTWFLLCRFLNSIREYKMNIKYEGKRSYIPYIMQRCVLYKPFLSCLFIAIFFIKYLSKFIFAVDFLRKQ
jgi:hypothetical protein